MMTASLQITRGPMGDGLFATAEWNSRIVQWKARHSRSTGPSCPRSIRRRSQSTVMLCRSILGSSTTPTWHASAGELRLSQRVHQEPANRGVGAECDVGTLVPQDARMVPVVPQIPHLCSWNQAVRYRREDVAALFRNSRIESEGGDYAQHFTHLVVHEALMLGVTDL